MKDLRIGCTSTALEVLENQVVPFFERNKTTKLQVIPILEGAEIDHSKYDFALLTIRQVKSLEDKLVSLAEFKQYLANCGGTGGRNDVLSGNHIPIGIPYNMEQLEEPSLPGTHDFLKGDGVALVVLNRSVLAPYNNREFYYLNEINRAITHYMPFVGAGAGDISIHLGERPQITYLNEQVDFIKLNGFGLESNKNEGWIGLSVSNVMDRPIRELHALIFGSEPSNFTNRHGETHISSRVNKVGPIVVYSFGSLLHGDTVTRRIRYKLNLGTDDIRIVFNPSLQNKTRMYSWGNGCSTEGTPDPIPDPEGDIIFLQNEGGKCVDVGCKNTHGDCNPHECATQNDECGCFAKSN